MIALQHPDLIERVQSFARATKKDEIGVLETAVRQYIERSEREKLHGETKAFWAMYAELLVNYNGEFVAVHEGNMIDHDASATTLEDRVALKYGDIPILIAPVTELAQRDLYTVSFRLEPV